MTEEPTASSGVDVGTRSVSDYTLPKDRGQSTSDDNRSSEYMRMNVYSNSVRWARARHKHHVTAVSALFVDRAH